MSRRLSSLLLTLPLVFAGPSKRTPAICQALEPVAQDLLQNRFDECGDSAHGALRLAFHDAIGISPTLGGGGADGSLLIFNATELTYDANNGLDDVLADLGPIFWGYQSVISPGDFIQLAGALSLAACQGAPKVHFSAGRPAPLAASPDNLIPEPFHSADQILTRFSEAGFSAAEVVALLASHTVAGADTVDPTIPGTPFDSTPSHFDTNFFLEVLLHGTLYPGTEPGDGEVESAIMGTMRLQSDSELARDSRTACTWQEYAVDHSAMTSAFAAAMFKLSLLGQTVGDLTDCSYLVPQPPSQPLLDFPTFPPGKHRSDIDQSCSGTPFPFLFTQLGPPLDVPPIPQDDD